MIEEVEEIILPSSPEDRKKMKVMFQEISDIMLEIETRKTLITEKLKDNAEKFGIKAKHLRKWSSAFHKRSFDKAAAEADAMEAVDILIIQGQADNERARQVAEQFGGLND